MRTSEKRRQRNFAFKSKIKTAVGNLKATIGENNKEKARQLLTEVYSLYDKAVKKGILKQNTAARHKSALTSMVNAL